MTLASKRKWASAVSVVVIGACALALQNLAFHRMERMNDQLSGMTSVLAVQVRGELEHLIHRVADLSERPEDNAVLSAADYDILSISIWEKSPDSALLGQVAELSHEKASVIGAPGTTAMAESEFEKKIIAEGFQGKSAIRLDQSQTASVGALAKTGLIVVPIGGIAKKRVALAHFRLDRFQRAFRIDSRIESMLLGSGGEILAHHDESRVGRISPLAKKVYATGAAHEGEFNELDVATEYPGKAADGKLNENHYNYKLVSQGQLAVVTDLPISDGALSSQELAMFWGMTLLFLGAGWTLFFTATGAKTSANESKTTTSASAPGPNGAQAKPAQIAQKRLLAVLQVFLLPPDPALEKISTEEFASVLNDFFEIGSSLVAESQGPGQGPAQARVMMERASGASFVVAWEDPAQAIRCALRMRQEYFRYSEAQKIEGKCPVSVVMGADWGMGLIIDAGPRTGRIPTTVGEVLAHARALALLAPSVGTDFLTSQTFWEQIAPGFVGEPAAEANLTTLSGLKACYRIKGYRDEDGKSVIMQISSTFPAASGGGPQLQKVVSNAPTLWMVNNGTQIYGPFSSEEIASRLYALELDFDCECWPEGTGARKSIAMSGMFGEPSDAGSGASLWVYDGKTVHGPMTEGFLRTALAHGAMSKEFWVCRESTVTGWHKIGEFLAAAEKTVVSTTALQDPPVAA
jgi:hypothetical protein